MAMEKSPQYGVLQEFVEALFAEAEYQPRIEIIIFAESYGLNSDLMEVINLLPPGQYTRDRFSSQVNSALSSHGWGYVYGAVY